MGVVVHVVDSSISSDVKYFNSLATVEDDHVVISFGYMCNGVAQMVSDIKARCTQGSISQIIIYGHGAPGVMGISMGKDGGGLNHYAGLSVSALKEQAVYTPLRSLRPYFSTGATMVLRGCNTAQGKSGEALITALAAILGVQVIASDAYQRVGRSDLIGEIRTASPDGTIGIDTKSGHANLKKMPFREKVLFTVMEKFFDAED